MENMHGLYEAENYIYVYINKLCLLTIVCAKRLSFVQYIYYNAAFPAYTYMMILKPLLKHHYIQKKFSLGALTGIALNCLRYGGS